jgi:hypothetical protein
MRSMKAMGLACLGALLAGLAFANQQLPTVKIAGEAHPVAGRPGPGEAGRDDDASTRAADRIARRRDQAAHGRRRRDALTGVHRIPESEKPR